MTNREQLIEQHIREHESRLKHIDELLERAREGVQHLPESGQIDAELAELDQERNKLVDRIEDIKRRSREEWQQDDIDTTGPMIIWQAVAKRLEKLLERIER